MAIIKVQHIASVSSEDKNYPAENLLKSGEFKKWICAKGGQKQASVVLQFEKASKIHAMDIGNEGSAFIEVLVGRHSDTEQNYQVLLVASSFMSPMESRNDTCTNRVRMFDSEKFSKGVLEEKWDRVKVVCTQPFNKTAQYGLSFIKFHSSEAQEVTPLDEGEAQSQRIGAFLLRDDADESALKPGSLFNKAKENTVTNTTLKGALGIRAASTQAEAKLLVPDPSLESLDKKVTSSDKSNTLSKERSEGTSRPSQHNKRKNEKDMTTKKTPVTDKKESLTSQAKNSRISKEPNDTSQAMSVPFDKLLSGVVFVLSGFQNPQRSDLRDKAMDMGAKYQPDWDERCTHLICAFPNTPKFQQVKMAKGKIVSKQWILDCYKRKTALKWHLYKMKGVDDDSSGSASDSNNPKSQSKPLPRGIKRKEVFSKNDDSKKSNKKAAAKNMSTNSEDEYAGSTDVDSPSERMDDNDETDTDDEIRRAMDEQNGSKMVLSPLPDTSNMPLPELPDYFHGSCFFLYGEFAENERRLLIRYIIAFNGDIKYCIHYLPYLNPEDKTKKVEDYMNEKVAYVITAADWDDNFDEALSSNSHLIFAKPKWIYACASKKKIIPHQPYIVVPCE